MELQHFHIKFTFSFTESHNSRHNEHLANIFQKQCQSFLKMSQKFLNISPKNLVFLGLNFRILFQEIASQQTFQKLVFSKDVSS